MTSPAAISYINLADSGTITASSAALPVANLQNVHISKRWRTTSNSGSFVIDLLSGVPIDTLAALGTTMSAVGTIRWRVSVADATGATGDAYDSGVVTVDHDYNCHVVALPAPVIGRYVRADLADGLGTYVEAGRAFVGTRTPFTYNFAPGWQRAWVDRSIVQDTRGGQTQVWRDNAYRTIDLTFSTLTAAQRNGLVEQVDIVCGRSRDLLFMTDPASSNMARDSIFGLMTDVSPVSQPFWNQYSKQYKIKERL